MADWIGTLGIIVASGTAIWGVWSWRKQMITERRMQIAEEVLSAFYEAQAVIRAVRSPVSFGGEGRSWRKAEHEKDERFELSRVDAFFAPAERLNKNMKFFAKLQALQYRFQAVFGPETEKYFKTVWNARIAVAVSSEALAQAAVEKIEGGEPTDEELLKSWKADIWWHTRNDKISEEMDALVRDVEGLCRPVLTRWLSP